MEEAREKLKILLVRKPRTADSAEGSASPWDSFVKALKTFTDLEVREYPEALPVSLHELGSGFAHTFLDVELADWRMLRKERFHKVTLVQERSFAWTSLETRKERQDALARHSCLVLEGFAAPDLLRALHLYLIPKRLAGVASLMEKGSLILGEKVMDANSVGALLDKLSAFSEQLEDFTLQERITDLRQVLSALLIEAFRGARSGNMPYPFVEFQVSFGKRKAAINLRFPKGPQSVDALLSSALHGSNLFWNQVWQCSDLTLLTYHRQYEEIEAMILISRPERNVDGRFQSILVKSSDNSPRREELLEPPQNYTFKLLSEVQVKSASELFLVDSSSPDEASEDEWAGVPDKIMRKFQKLDEQNRVLQENIQRKDQQLQDSIKRLQQGTRELNARRAEILRLTQAADAQGEKNDRRVRELEAANAQLNKAAQDSAATKAPAASNAHQEVVARLEGTLRAAENEKNQLKESVAHEQRKVALLEQKYSQLYKDIGTKDREINELKGTLTKVRKDQAHKAAKPMVEENAKDSPAALLKAAEERETIYKQEIKKLTFNLESKDKNIKSLQTEAAEKQKLLDQKLKAAKTKEVELLKRIEELTASLKKASKAA